MTWRGGSHDASAGGPNNSRLAPLFDQASPAARGHDLGLADHGDGLEVESVDGLARWHPGFSEMAFDAAATAFGQLMLGHRCQEARRRPSLLVGLGEQRRQDRSSSCRVTQLSRKRSFAKRPDGAEFVIEMKRHQFDGDVGNGGGIGREAWTECVEIRQSTGIEFTVDGLGEFGLAGTVMSERQQPDHGAAHLLLAVTGEQRF
jgi:hypothetical protein